MANQLNFKKYIGAGNFSCVFLADYQDREVAVKLYKDFFSDDVPFGFIQREVNVLDRLTGIDGVVQLYDYFEDFQIEKSEFDNLGIEIPQKHQAPKYSTAIVMQYVDSEVDIRLEDSLNGDEIFPNVSDNFFTKFHQTVLKVHAREITIPPDITVLIKDDNPYLCDWSLALSYNPKREKLFEILRALNLDMTDRLKTRIRGSL